MDEREDPKTEQHEEVEGSEDQDTGNVVKPDGPELAQRDPESEKIAQKAHTGPMGDMKRPAGEMRSNFQRRKGG